MRWKAEDMEQIIAMQEYVDTLLYPVCVSGEEWDESWIKNQFWLERVCGYAERQLTGRLFLFQPLCVALTKEADEEISYMFIQQNIQALSRRFTHCIVVTNDNTVSIELTKRGIETYLVSDPPEEKADTKAFLEKALSESNRIVKRCIALWQNN
ncbi:MULTISPECIES: DUF2487 family protein [Aneurinibacillus]|jgi:hypothetical protein|uniref:DUF2487 domain-containing protein n=1 Tax=Aneurinibacillus danicus TaxID=267746 RepID=A0A511VAK0_9BACL|nr:MULTISPECIES: DUF2487 family protein [Aneurinibacillus]GEN34252.1 hypothetical protein ADA01nite_17120 [Aneurinibacillus danicus]